MEIIKNNFSRVDIENQLRIQNARQNKEVEDLVSHMKNLIIEKS